MELSCGSEPSASSNIAPMAVETRSAVAVDVVEPLESVEFIPANARESGTAAAETARGAAVTASAVGASIRRAGRW